MSKEFKIGLIAVIAGGLLYYGFNFLRGSDLFSLSNRYFVTYKNVSGLSVSNPIYLNGLPVGRVSGFQLEQKKQRIIVALDIDQNVELTDGVIAHLANDGLLGTKAIVLVFKESSETLQPGDTLEAETDSGLFERFDPAIDNINTTITKLNNLLDELNSTDISGIVDTLKYSIAILTNKVNNLELESTVENTNNLLISFKDRSDQLETLLASSNSLVDSLSQVLFNKTFVKLNESMDQVNSFMAAMQSDSGTLGQLMTNDSLYQNLNKTLVDLDKLIIHFDNYPKDFMKPLGRKHKKLEGMTKDDD